MRRIVTGHNKEGKSIINIDGPPARTLGEDVGGLYELWNTDGKDVNSLDNIDRAKNKLELADGAMEQTVNILTRIYELTIQAENDIHVASDRSAIKMEISQLKDAMFQVVNTEDASGQALFAGYKVNKNAFADLFIFIEL